MAGHVWAIAGGKGGVGKTTTAGTLGRILADRGRDVAVIDADLGMGNIANALDVDGADETQMYDVLADEAPLEAATTETDGLTVFAGRRVAPSDDADRSTQLRSYGDADPARLRPVIERLRADHELVLVDTAGGLVHETAVSVGLADGAVLLTTPGEMAVENAATTAAFVDRVGGDLTGVVVTRATAETDVTTIADRLGYPLLGVVPDADLPIPRGDPAVPVVNGGDEATGGIADAYRGLADVLEAIEGGASAGEVAPARERSWFESATTVGDSAADGDGTPETDADGDGDIGSSRPAPGEANGSASVGTTAPETNTETDTDTTDPDEQDSPGLLRRLLGLG